MVERTLFQACEYHLREPLHEFKNRVRVADTLHKEVVAINQIRFKEER